MQALLVTHHLRDLSLAAGAHPHAKPHFSAASGLVCQGGRAYVIGDDEHHLALYRDAHSPGQLHRLLPGNLPQDAAARKRAKPDLECLFALPNRLAPGALGGGALIALGSGSRRHRCQGVLIDLDPLGQPASPHQAFDLTPLYAPLLPLLGDINIEGGWIWGNSLILLNRGVDGRSPNAALHYRLLDFMALVGGRGRALAPHAITPYELGRLEGVALGFTDGAALQSGGWVFSAAAEDRDNSVADGPCAGSVVGRVDAAGRLMAVRRLAQACKVEGIAAHVDGSGVALCMVTDADDPQRSAEMLLARL